MDIEEMRILRQSLNTVEVIWGNMVDLLPCHMSHETIDQLRQCLHCTPPFPKPKSGQGNPPQDPRSSVGRAVVSSTTRSAVFPVSPLLLQGASSIPGGAACAAACPGRCQCIPSSVSVPVPETVKEVSVQTDLRCLIDAPLNVRNVGVQTSSPRQIPLERTAPDSHITQAAENGLLPRPNLPEITLHPSGSSIINVEDDDDDGQINSSISPIRPCNRRRKRKVLTQVPPLYSYDVNSETVPYSDPEEDQLSDTSFPRISISPPLFVSSTPKRRYIHKKKNNN